MSEALSIANGLFIDDAGRVFPITNWFDFEGDECAPEDATVCVAGEGNSWFSLLISDFSESAPAA